MSYIKALQDGGVVGFKAVRLFNHTAFLVQVAYYVQYSPGLVDGVMHRYLHENSDLARAQALKFYPAGACEFLAYEFIRLKGEFPDEFSEKEFFRFLTWTRVGLELTLENRYVGEDDFRAKHLHHQMVRSMQRKFEDLIYERFYCFQGHMLVEEGVEESLGGYILSVYEEGAKNGHAIAILNLLDYYVVFDPNFGAFFIEKSSGQIADLGRLLGFMFRPQKRKRMSYVLMRYAHETGAFDFDVKFGKGLQWEVV